MGIRTSIFTGALVLLTSSSVLGQDFDGDGFLDKEDFCFRTPRGVAAIARGCSALEISQTPRLVLERVDAAIQQARRQLETREALAEVVRSLDEGRTQLERGALRIRRGEVCKGVSGYREGARTLGSAQSTLAEIASDLMLDVRAEQAMVNDAVLSAQQTGEFLGAACASVTGVETTQGTVVRTDDAAGLVELDGGRLFGLPTGQIDIYEGADVTITATKFSDGSGIGSKITIGPASDFPDIAAVQCIALRIAPIQGFEPALGFPGPYTLHHPKAYEVSDLLELEQGMRLAAERRCVTWMPAQNTYKRYSLKLDLEYGTTLDPYENWPKTVVTLASDLTDGEAPVALPADLKLSDPLEIGFVPETLTVTGRSQTCPNIFGMPCGPFDDVFTETYDLRVKTRNSYGAVHYKEEFEPDDLSSIKSVMKVDLVHLNFQAPAGTFFEAEGWALTWDCMLYALTPDCLSLTWVPKGFAFAILNPDFYSDDMIDPFGTVGVDHAAGLRWPRVRGTRNGHEFWYSARLPIVLN